MPDFKVRPEKVAELLERMDRLGVREEDLEEQFVRSSGPGGQHVNKPSTCVVLRPLPTGIVVKAQRERSQAINRFLARRTLLDRLEAATGLPANRKLEILRVRRQKDRRRRRHGEGE